MAPGLGSTNVSVNFVGIDPVRALILSAAINGGVAAPSTFLITRIANNPEIMGFMGASGLGMFATYLG